ncbi:DUF1456 family protein [Eupransor demetentiae]|uniref:DUF1456 family (YehS) n=1 Tax=Eupransor demetentiae TaxID=3109584 RepID=A0ABM9N3G2_9LACO|nr:DUF1456 family (YehS) [Lactobacillaceae bacterium LMG 33000]
MNNNDILIRLRYALSLSDNQMLRIFELGDLKIGQKDLDLILTKQEDDQSYDDYLSTKALEAFLNGFVIFKRGHKRDKEGKILLMSFDIADQSEINNVAIKKIKIAMAYTSEEIQALMKKAGAPISKGELSAILRRPGHRNYRPAGDRYLRKLLQGMTMQYRS